MADPIEVRRVVIEYEIRMPTGSGFSADDGPGGPPPLSPEQIEQVRRELIRNGSRNPDVFGGRA